MGAQHNDRPPSFFSSPSVVRKQGVRGGVSPPSLVHAPPCRRCSVVAHPRSCACFPTAWPPSPHPLWHCTSTQLCMFSDGVAAVATPVVALHIHAVVHVFRRRGRRRHTRCGIAHPYSCACFPTAWPPSPLLRLFFCRLVDEVPLARFQAIVAVIVRFQKLPYTFSEPPDRAGVV